jgi:hypothetical protein
MAVLDTRRASALTGAAEKTEVQMIFETFVQVDAPFGGGAN